MSPFRRLTACWVKLGMEMLLPRPSPSRNELMLRHRATLILLQRSLPRRKRNSCSRRASHSTTSSCHRDLVELIPCGDVELSSCFPSSAAAPASGSSPS